MAVRDKLRDRIQPFLEPGEEPEQVFVVMTGPRPTWLIPVPILMALLLTWHAVAVTDRAIVVARSSYWSGGTKLKELTARLPRNTRLGPVRGLLVGGPLYLTPDGKKSWVGRRFFEDVRASDITLEAINILEGSA